jgi:hypothetical protein
MRWRVASSRRALTVLGPSAILPSSTTSPSAAAVPSILVLGPGENLRGVIAEAVRRRSVRLAFLNGTFAERLETWEPQGNGWRRSLVNLGGAQESQEVLDRAGDAWAALRRSASFQVAWRDGDVDYIDVVADWLRGFVCETVPRLIATVDRAAEAIERLRPAAVIAEVTGPASVKAAITAARQHGTPVSIYRHGASLGYLTMEDRLAPEEYHNDARYADTLLCWGGGDVAFFQKWSDVKAIAVGATALDELRRLQGSSAWARRRERVRWRLGIPATSPCVAYVLQNTPYAKFATPYRYRLPDVEWAIQRAIVKAFAAHPHAVLLVEAHPARDSAPPPLDALVRDEGLHNVRVSRNDGMGDVLAAADMFITDFPTTAFLEMLTTTKPVFVCGEEMPSAFAPGPRLAGAWAARVVYRETVAGLLEALAGALATPPAAASDHRLLRDFGVHLDDGGSAARVMDLLEAS